MRAGNLDRRVTIQRAGPATDDGYTIVPGELEEYAIRWASWKPANGREVFENQGREAKSAGSFWFRYDSKTRNITETDKVAFDGQLWDIVSKTQIDRREGVEVIVVASDEEFAAAAVFNVFSAEFSEAFQ